MKDKLLFILSAIVQQKDALVVEEQEENGITNLTISVAKEDIGRIIGKNGKIIRAIRNVMKIPAIKQNKRIYISLLES